MAIYTIFTFDLDNEVEKEFKRITDSVVDKEVSRMCDEFIVSLVEMTKKVIRDETYNELADEYVKYLLSSSLSRKISFFKSFELSVQEVVEDIYLLVNEFKKFSLDNKKVDEKKEAKKSYSKKKLNNTSKNP